MSAPAHANSSEYLYFVTAERGDESAQYKLALGYHNGCGAPKEIKEAVKWYSRSAEQGNTGAYQQLQALAQAGSKDAFNAIYEIAHQCNDSTGQYYLAQSYHNGCGVAKDITEAIKWYRQSAAQGSIIAGDQLQALAQEGNKDAFNAISELADQGNSAGMYYLAQRYERGDGVTQNVNKAIKLYHRSMEQGFEFSGLYSLARQGNKDAFNAISDLAKKGSSSRKFCLGQCYLNGYGVTQNIEEGIKWHHTAAEQGSTVSLNQLEGMALQGNSDAFKAISELANQGIPMAQYFLGQHLEKGHGIPQNMSEAIKWYRLSAEQGNTFASDRLHTLAQQGSKEAFNVISELAKQGNPTRQYCLAICYRYGVGVSKDIRKAMKWYFKADEQGDATAHHILQFSVQKTNKDEFSATSDLANQGNSTGQFFLGHCHHKIAKDINKAVKWYRQSTEQGNINAGCQLSYLARDGNKDAFNAIFELANQGNSTGQFYLGHCYENGHGVTQSINEAIELYRQSAEQGDPSAGSRLLYLAQHGNKDAFNAISGLAQQRNSTGQYRLGQCHEGGHGVAQNSNEAIKLYRQSAEQGNTIAGEQLLSLVGQANEIAFNSFLGRQRNKVPFNGDLFRKDNKNALDANVIEKAFSAICELANVRNSTGQYCLAACYQYGFGVNKDINEAIKLYRQSIEQGNRNSRDQLHALAQLGNKDAFDVISELANHGDSTEQYHLGVCYENGNAVARDINEAIKWYRQSAAQGDNIAGDQLLSMAQEGDKDAFSAISALANQGNSTGQFYLGRCYQNGYGVIQNVDEALNWYRKAAEQGSKTALLLLHSLAQDQDQESN